MAPSNDTSHTSAQIKLLTSLKCQNLDDFTSIIRSKNIDVNYFYTDPDNGTLLDIACRSKHNSQFVRILLDQKHTNINAINKITGLAAIHEAVKNADEDTLKILMESTTPNGSICSLNTPDRNGNTALHIAIKRNNIKFVNMLLQKCCIRVDINQYTRQNGTPLHLALNQGNLEAANVLLELEEIDLDFQRDSQGRTCREIIQLRYPDLSEKLSTFRSTCKIESILFSLLSRHETESFIEVASGVDVEHLNDNYDYQTYLHYACEYGLADVVDMLLEKQVDPNKKSITGHTPIILAAKNNHYDIFMKLLNHTDVRLQIEGVESALHTIILDMFAKNHDSRCDHTKCLKLLLDEAVPRDKLDINLPDQYGWTALHYAVLLNDQRVIRILLQAGAHLYQKNPKGEVPLTSIKSEALADLLDSCISPKNESAFVSDYAIIFDYKILAQPSVDHVRDGNEMMFFSILENAPELRKHLKHPLLKSFLHMKWYLVRKYYFIHFILILVFCSTLTCYVIDSNHHLKSSSNKTSPTDETSTSQKYWRTIPLFFVYIILCLKELFKIGLYPNLYIKSLENMFKIAMMLVTAPVLIFDPNSYDKWRVFAASAILASWTKTMFLLGKHPCLSTQIEMLKTVAWNFFKFLAPYSIMIFGFAFSFLILLKDERCNESCKTLNETNSNIDIVQGFVIKVFRLFSMLTGNIDSEFVPLHCEVNTNSVFFILFIFLVSIVLYNLLNGLAVSDTKAIREDAELIGIVSQIKFISYLERVLTIPNRNPFCGLGCYLPSCFHCAEWWLPRKIRILCCYVKIFHHRITLFPKNFQETRVRVFPYRNNVVLFPNDEVRSTGSRISKPYKWRMDQDIVKQSVDMLDKRGKSCHIDNLSQCLQLIQRQQSKFQTIENAIQRISEQINDLKVEIGRKKTLRDN